jgi:hypothetical protein
MAVSDGHAETLARIVLESTQLTVTVPAGEMAPSATASDRSLVFATGMKPRELLVTVAEIG